MSETKGYIYILTNPSFPDYVKIGYAGDVESRVKQLNNSECIPFAFRIYATYEVPKALTDLSLHNLIDKLNPSLRSIDVFNGKPRKREFYAMTREDAYSILEAIAEIHDRTDKLTLYTETAEEKAEEETAELVEIEVGARRKTQPISLTEYLSGKPDALVDLYKKLQNDVYDAVENAEMHVLPQYIGWRVNGKYFAEIHIQRNKIMILTLPPREKYAVGEKLPDKYLWALNYRSYFNSIEDFDDVKAILLDSYDQRAN